MYKYIEINGAKEHNLKNISIKIPKNKLVAITGPSGSGKSTFAFDILQRECQRQYMESMGMVTDGMNKANVSSIVGLSPSISISQGKNNRNPRSTVGTFTEILTYLRLLYAKCGKKEGRSSFEANLTMAHFSFNKPEGMCRSCNGLGEVNAVDPSRIVNEDMRISEGAVLLWKGVIAEHYEYVLNKTGEHYGFTFNAAQPVKNFNELEKLVFYEGVDSEAFKERFPGIKRPKKVSDGYFEGITTFLDKKSAENIRKGSSNRKIEACFTRQTCSDCGGTRLNEQARSISIDNKHITEVSSYTLEELQTWVLMLNKNTDPAFQKVYEPVMNDILSRLDSVIKIGLGYLNIDRSITSLSGGEAQRLRMASLMDSGLTGVLYILDEPTTGLHPKDTEKILSALKHLRDLGNTILVIEHDMSFVRQCDYVIDFGPHSGIHGGEIVAEGKPSEIQRFERSLTGKYLNKKHVISTKPALTTTNYIEIKGASAHNLKQVDVQIPLGKLVTFAGVSGSGKSSLVFDVLAKYAMKGRLQAQSVMGLNAFERVVQVDQKRIGRSLRSTVATYTDLFTSIRELYSNQKQAKLSKLKGSDFSFNVKGGRCEKCLGLGVIPLDMHFLDDIEVTCPECDGKRFNDKVLGVTYKGLTISDVLGMTVSQSKEVFSNNDDIYTRLQILEEVGLGYLTLGQTTSTLSGGECQRIKISKELGRISNGKTLYLLDEPTTGLHPSDIEKLISLLKKFVLHGHTVLLIEHELEVISQSDWIIELGPEGGTKGGQIIAQGRPMDIIQSRNSSTGIFLEKEALTVK